MSKIIPIILSLLIFTSCSTKPTEENIVYAYNYDFQFYGFDVGECVLKGSTVSALKSTIDNKGTAIFIISSPICFSCKIAIEIANEISKENSISIYNIDPYSSQYPVFDTDDFDILLDILKEIGINNENDFFMPIVLVINVGNIDAYYNENSDEVIKDVIYSKINSVINKSLLIK